MIWPLATSPGSPGPPLIPPTALPSVLFCSLNACLFPEPLDLQFPLQAFYDITPLTHLLFSFHLITAFVSCIAHHRLKSSCLSTCSFIYLFIYLVVLGLSCGMQTLSCNMGDLVPWPGIELGPPALGACSLNHCGTREVPAYLFLISLWEGKLQPSRYYSVDM